MEQPDSSKLIGLLPAHWGRLAQFKQNSTRIEAQNTGFGPLGHFTILDHDLEAVMKSAASAASLGFAGERQDDGTACGRRGTGRSPANPLEPALAAHLITASSIRLLVVP